MRARQAIVVVASVLALALTASAVLAASAHATFPGRNGLITFTSSVTPHHQIFVMNPDGSGLRQITPGTADCTAPSISPDGKTIVFFQGTASGVIEISAMTTTGANLRHLATGSCEDPSFSPNGRQVVFLDGGQVWLMNANGSHQRRLTALASDTRAWSVTYSPDGRTIVFIAGVWVGPPSAKDRGEILAMNADGTHLRRLAYTTEPNYLWVIPPRGVSFSPDGKKIVYGASTKTIEVVRIMNADGSGQHLVSRSYGFENPCYSPDGQQIVCLNGHNQVSVVNANGTHWRQLTHIPGGAMAPDWGPHVR